VVEERRERKAAGQENASGPLKTHIMESGQKSGFVDGLQVVAARQVVVLKADQGSEGGKDAK
jgi:hypothetical protein